MFLTVNPVEYHGPHLSLHNDRLVSLGLIRDLHERLLVRHPEWPLLVAADLEVGVEPCSGPGSRHGRYAIAVEPGPGGAAIDNSRFAPAFAHVADPDERAEMLRTLRHDFHAGFFETSVALHYAPESVSPEHRGLPPCPPFGQARMHPWTRMPALSIEHMD